MDQVPQEAVKSPPPAPHTDPWTALRREVDQLFDRFSHSFGLSAPSPAASAPQVMHCKPAWPNTAPVVDITETDESFKMTAELPGLTESDVEVSVAGGMLVLRGEKHHDRDDNRQGYRLTERNFDAFQRSFTLPACVDAEKIDAQFADGKLTVVLPKCAVKAAEPGKKIEVKTAA